MAEHEPGHRRIRFGEELHRRQRVEQEMGLDLRLHQLQLSLGCLLREQIAIGFGSQYLGPRVCLAVLEQEQQTDKKAVAKSADESPHEGVRMRSNLGQSIALDGQSISLDQNHQRHSYRRAD